VLDLVVTDTASGDDLLLPPLKLPLKLGSSEDAVDIINEGVREHIKTLLELDEDEDEIYDDDDDDDDTDLDEEEEGKGEALSHMVRSATSLAKRGYGALRGWTRVRGEEDLKMSDSESSESNEF